MLKYLLNNDACGFCRVELGEGKGSFARDIFASSNNGRGRLICDAVLVATSINYATLYLYRSDLGMKNSLWKAIKVDMPESSMEVVAKRSANGKGKRAIQMVRNESANAIATSTAGSFPSSSTLPRQQSRAIVTSRSFLRSASEFSNLHTRDLSRMHMNEDSMQFQSDFQPLVSADMVVLQHHDSSKLEYSGSDYPYFEQGYSNRPPDAVFQGRVRSGSVALSRTAGSSPSNGIISRKTSESDRESNAGSEVLSQPEAASDPPESFVMPRPISQRSSPAVFHEVTHGLVDKENLDSVSKSAMSQTNGTTQSPFEQLQRQAHENTVFQPQFFTSSTNSPDVLISSQTAPSVKEGDRPEEVEVLDDVAAEIGGVQDNVTESTVDDDEMRRLALEAMQAVEITQPPSSVAPSKGEEAPNTSESTASSVSKEELAVPLLLQSVGKKYKSLGSSIRRCLFQVIESSAISPQAAAHKLALLCTTLQPISEKKASKSSKSDKLKKKVNVAGQSSKSISTPEESARTILTVLQAANKARLGSDPAHIAKICRAVLLHALFAVEVGRQFLHPGYTGSLTDAVSDSLSQSLSRLNLVLGAPDFRGADIKNAFEGIFPATLPETLLAAMGSYHVDNQHHLVHHQDVLLSSSQPLSSVMVMQLLVDYLKRTYESDHRDLWTALIHPQLASYDAAMKSLSPSPQKMPLEIMPRLDQTVQPASHIQPFSIDENSGNTISSNQSANNGPVMEGQNENQINSSGGALSLGLVSKPSLKRQNSLIADRQILGYHTNRGLQKAITVMPPTGAPLTANNNSTTGSSVSVANASNAPPVAQQRSSRLKKIFNGISSAAANAAANHATSAAAAEGNMGIAEGALGPEGIHGGGRGSRSLKRTHSLPASQSQQLPPQQRKKHILQSPTRTTTPTTKRRRLEASPLLPLPSSSSASAAILADMSFQSPVVSRHRRGSRAMSVSSPPAATTLHSAFVASTPEAVLGNQNQYRNNLWQISSPVATLKGAASLASRSGRSFQHLLQQHHVALGDMSADGQSQQLLMVPQQEQPLPQIQLQFSQQIESEHQSGIIRNQHLHRNNLTPRRTSPRLAAAASRSPSVSPSSDREHTVQRGSSHSLVDQRSQTVNARLF